MAKMRMSVRQYRTLKRLARGSRAVAKVDSALRKPHRDLRYSYWETLIIPTDCASVFIKHRIPTTPRGQYRCEVFGRLNMNSKANGGSVRLA